jgi:hypothetical protein
MRRDAVGSRDLYRYDALLRHLQAGRELPVPRRRRRSFRFDIHPSAGRLLGLAVAVALLYLVVALVAGYVRSVSVDTWGGPDGSVQSGQRLAGCPQIETRTDVYFPTWIRFEGRIYHWVDAAYPIGPDSIPGSYVPTDYVHDDLRILHIVNTPEGRSGEAIMVRQGEAPAGAVYRVEPACS